MFDVSYHKSFIFLAITIGNTLSVVSRLYVSYKLINFELEETGACVIVNVLIRAGLACLGVDNGAQELLFQVMLSTSGPGPPSDSGGLRCFGGPASPALTPQPGSPCGQWKQIAMSVSVSEGMDASLHLAF